jgi:hypothetical protein
MACDTVQIVVQEASFQRGLLRRFSGKVTGLLKLRRFRGFGYIRIVSLITADLFYIE